jgi:hypothetical protein
MHKIQVSKLIVKITHWCKTGCNLCLEWQKKDIDFFTSTEIDTLIQTIDTSLSVIDKNTLSIFTLYGSSVLRHPEVIRLMDYVVQTLPHITFCLDVGDVAPYDPAYMDLLTEISKRYRVIYVFVRNLTDMHMLRNTKDWIQFFEFLNLHPWFLSLPPSIRYNDNDYISLKILQKVLAPYSEVIPVYARHPYPDHAQHIFYSEKLGTSTCKYLTYLSKKEESETLVFGHEENEVNLMLDGTLTMHTNICYLSKYRYITNINLPTDIISKEIDQYISNLEMVNAGDIPLQEACYRCIYGVNKS